MTRIRNALKVEIAKQHFYFCYGRIAVSIEISLTSKIMVSTSHCSRTQRNAMLNVPFDFPSSFKYTIRGYIINKFIAILILFLKHRPIPFAFGNLMLAKKALKPIQLDFAHTNMHITYCILQPDHYLVCCCFG